MRVAQRRRPAADQGRQRGNLDAVTGLTALIAGLAGVALTVWQLLDLPFQPGQSGFASVFVGFYPVALDGLVRRDDLAGDPLARARDIPAISSWNSRHLRAGVQVQRFQSSLSAFTTVWNYLAIVTFIFGCFHVR